MEKRKRDQVMKQKEEAAQKKKSDLELELQKRQQKLEQVGQGGRCPPEPARAGPAQASTGCRPRGITLVPFSSAGTGTGTGALRRGWGSLPVPPRCPTLSPPLQAGFSDPTSAEVIPRSDLS